MRRELFEKLMRQEQKQPEKLRNSKGGKDLVIAVVRHIRSMLLRYCMTYAHIMYFIWYAWFSLSLEHQRSFLIRILELLSSLTTKILHMLYKNKYSWTEALLFGSALLWKLSGRTAMSFSLTSACYWGSRFSHRILLPSMVHRVKLSNSFTKLLQRPRLDGKLCARWFSFVSI